MFGRDEGAVSVKHEQTRASAHTSTRLSPVVGPPSPDRGLLQTGTHGCFAIDKRERGGRRAVLPLPEQRSSKEEDGEVALEKERKAGPGREQRKEGEGGEDALPPRRKTRQVGGRASLLLTLTALATLDPSTLSAAIQTQTGLEVRPPLLSALSCTDALAAPQRLPLLDASPRRNLSRRARCASRATPSQSGGCD